MPIGRKSEGTQGVGLEMKGLNEIKESKQGPGTHLECWAVDSRV